MTVACAVCAAIEDVETVPASLIAVAAMMPALFLFLVAVKFVGSKHYLPYVLYFGYYGLWTALLTYAYFTAVELPQLGLIAITFLSIAAFFGFLPLIWSGRYSLRGLLIVTTLIAVLLSLIAYVM
jgi:hypothetical protein